ncbi:hypothetical protein [Microbulbifer sp. JMSA003]|uniref:hypothetical protein n=1 Tax=Microbulbifer sp. JMSA003 TaxID=3243369 RepID=UPI00403A0E45
MKIAQELNSLQEDLYLEVKAFNGASAWVNSEDFGMEKNITESFEFYFKFHKFCFKHAEFEYLYIETTLGIDYHGEEVGYYSLFSDLDGEPVDDMLIITDEELKNS